MKMILKIIWQIILTRAMINNNNNNNKLMILAILIIKRLYK